MSANKRFAAVKLAVLLTATLVLGAPSLLYPFGFDQSNQAVSASMVLDGAVPFSEVPSLKPPFTIAFHAVAIALFGKSMTALRLLDLIWTALTAIVIAACAQRISRAVRGVGVISGIAYVHTYYCFSFWHSAQTDGWMNLPIAGAMYLVLRAWDLPGTTRRRQFVEWAGVGALTVAALLFKYSAGGFVGLFALAAAASFLRGRRAGVLATGGLMAGVLAASGCLMLVLFLWGAWDGFLHDHLVTAIHYADASASTADTSPFVIRLLSRLTDLGPAPMLLWTSPKTFWLGAVGAGFLLVPALRRNTGLRDRGKVALLLGWLGAAWMSTAVQGRYFGYHFLPLLAPWAICAGMLCARAMCWVRARLASHWMRWGGLLAVAMVVVWANCGPFSYPYLPLRQQYGLLARVLSGETVEDTWRRGPYEVAPNFSVRETMAVVDYLRANSSPSDSLFVWGSNQAIYYLAARPQVSLMTTAWQASAQRITAGAKNGGARLLADFQATPPTIVLLQHGDAIPAVLGDNKDSYTLLGDAPEVRAFLEKHYRMNARVGRFDVLVRVVP